MSRGSKQLRLVDEAWMGLQIDHHSTPGCGFHFMIRKSIIGRVCGALFREY